MATTSKNSFGLGDPQKLMDWTCEQTAQWILSTALPTKADLARRVRATGCDGETLCEWKGVTDVVNDLRVEPTLGMDQPASFAAATIASGIGSEPATADATAAASALISGPVARKVWRHVQQGLRSGVYDPGPSPRPSPVRAQLMVERERREMVLGRMLIEDGCIWCEAGRKCPLLSHKAFSSRKVDPL